MHLSSRPGLAAGAASPGRRAHRAPYAAPTRLAAAQRGSRLAPARLAPRAAAPEQPADACAPSDPEAVGTHLLSLWQARDLEGLLPYMSELSVVKAVVRTHAARAAEARAASARAAARQHAQHESYAAQQEAYYDAYEPSPYFAAAPGGYSAAQGWGGPPRPSCPVPGAASPDYADDYESFNYAQRYAWASPNPGEGGMPPPPPGAYGAGLHAQATPTAQVPDFLAVLDAAQAGDDAHHLLDSYAMRHLILSRPAQLEALSSMRLGPDSFVLRARSTSLWGEKCVLTLSLKRRSEAEQKSTYSKQPHKAPWVLARVSGEPCSAEPLEAISAEHPPEAIVAAQVQALKDCDFDVAYALTSPVGRAVAGTRERFRAALQGDYRYQAVLMHTKATSIHRTHSNANTYLEVFDVQGSPGAGSSLFIWVATRQLEGLYKNCWLVEYLTPIRDAEVIKALHLSF